MQPVQEFPAQGIEVGALAGVADGFRHGARLRFDPGGEHLLLAAQTHPTPQIITAEENQSQEQNCERHPNSDFGYSHRRRNRAQPQRPQAAFNQCIYFRIVVHTLLFLVCVQIVSSATSFAGILNSLDRAGQIGGSLEV